MQIAIGKRGRVSLWCDVYSTLDDGTIEFKVINGLWKGSVGDGKVFVQATKEWHDGDVLWTGTAPFGLEEYNEAISWIEAQIAEQNPCFQG